MSPTGWKERSSVLKKIIKQNLHIAHHGFTLIELMVVVAIIAILATIAKPDQSPRMVKAQIAEALALAMPYKSYVSEYYHMKNVFPLDNKALGIDSPEKIRGNYLEAMSIANGAINLHFGNKAHQAIQDKTLTLRPVFVADAETTPISWVCGHGKVPTGMLSSSRNQTDIETKYLPINCF